MTPLPGTRSLRQRVAFVFLMLGVALIVRSLANEWPREQTLVFRLDDGLSHTPLRLDTSVTRVGESEARGGMSVERDGSERGNPRQTLRLPDGDYVVTVAWERKSAVGARTDEAKEGETTNVHRVTLEGGEVVVPVRSRATE